tara:strand:- start:413 stop:787 length:375 start_codon:yes stop_codon:yes gene_type:complete
LPAAPAGLTKSFALCQPLGLTVKMQKLTPKQLGDAGENHAVALLEKKGYKAEKLEINAPTYDVKASKGGEEFLISVKVARDKQHVRMGSRRSVLRLKKVTLFLPSYRPRKAVKLLSLNRSNTDY